MGMYFDAAIYYGVRLSDEEGYFDEGLPWAGGEDEVEDLDQWLREHQSPVGYAQCGYYDGYAPVLLVLPGVSVRVSSSNGCIKEFDFGRDLRLRADQLRDAVEFCDHHDCLPSFLGARWLLVSSYG